MAVSSSTTPAPRSAAPRKPNPWQFLTGLQTKFTVLVVALAVALAVLAGSLVMNLASRLVSRANQQHCRQLAGILASAVAEDLRAGREPLSCLPRVAQGAEPLLFTTYLSPDGRVLAHRVSELWHAVGDPPAGLTPGVPVSTALATSAVVGLPAHLDLTWPVWGDSGSCPDRGAEAPATLVGYVRLGVSLAQEEAQVAETRASLAAWGAALLALAVPVGFLLIRQLVGPLHELGATMTCLAEGDLTARSPIRRRDEIGRLAEVYNLMAEKLAQKHQEISQLNAELEERVQQRTNQLRDLAARDPLTGLYNRRHFKEVLTGRFAEAQRYATELSCLMLDLDNFKAANDRFGHQTGDDLLILTGITVTTQLRTADVAARFGGDEFIILLPQTDPASAQILAERMRRKLNAAFADQYPHCPMTVSMGIGCMLDVSTQNPDELIRAADQALYEAKSRGKDAIVVNRVPVP